MSSLSSKFIYKRHLIDDSLKGDEYCFTAAADLDGDGRPEFIMGQKSGNIYWYDYKSPGVWERFLLASGAPADVGLVVYDVDGDGLPDLITGGIWFKNSGDPKNKPFKRFVFDPEIQMAHDLIVCDINGDGKQELLLMSDQSNLRWYRIPDNPEKPWTYVDVGPAVHCGMSVGDIDGDGDLDIVRSDIWFENVKGDGTEWVQHPLGPCGGTSGWEESATLSVVCDMNKDGCMDVVVADAEIPGAKIAWMENVDGSGLKWKRHELPHSDTKRRGAYHSLYVGDLDGDGDLDIFSVEMEGVPGDRPPRFYIWENVDGRGMEFKEHIILDEGIGGHAAVVADFDGDGDLDICSKLWTPRPDRRGKEPIHVDFLENIRVNE